MTKRALETTQLEPHLRTEELIAFQRASQPVQKRYFTTDKCVNEYPYEFTASRNKRFVHVIACHLFVDDPAVEDTIERFSVPQFVRLHADFIQDSCYLDSYVCMCNQVLPKRKKYEQFNNERGFKLWFRNYDGSQLDMTNMHFVLELLLEY